jgi:hypothetical protein
MSVDAMVRNCFPSEAFGCRRQGRKWMRLSCWNQEQQQQTGARSYLRAEVDARRLFASPERAVKSNECFFVWLVKASMICSIRLISQMLTRDAIMGLYFSACPSFVCCLPTFIQLEFLLSL